MSRERYLAAERKLSHFLHEKAIHFLRCAMGLIFIWFGMLKIMGISPVEELVYRATHWIGVHNFVIFLGGWEVVIGICFWVRKWNRLGLLLFFLQIPGTFLPLFLNPEDCFTAIPFGLTLEGQYIVKNLVLIAGALILVGSLHPPRRES